MKVLFIIDNAPDYRENFFRDLGLHCELTVISHSCTESGLSAPFERKNYNYIEIQTTKKGPFFFISSKIDFISDYEIICVEFIPRHLWRFLLFLKNKQLWDKWLWWGHIYGRSNNPVLNFIRKQFLKRSAAILTYSKHVAKRVQADVNGVPVISINNSQSKKSDFMTLDWPEIGSLNFIFVGRPQERKRLDRIINIAREFPFTNWRLIGPDMADYIYHHFGTIPGNVHCFDKCTGDELIKHFSWCHGVVNPGHLGLLISNAALHGRPVLIQKNEIHAPEIILAEESAQIFIDFDNNEETKQIFNEFMQDITSLKQAAMRLQVTANMNYTIEYMVEKHMEGFSTTYNATAKES